MRAREPVAAGMVDRDGIHIAYEDFGGPGPAIVFAPIDPIVTTLAWKAQVPYLARYGRVVTIDPRGNGLSDRPLEPTAYADVEFVGDIIAVMDQARHRAGAAHRHLHERLVEHPDGRAAPGAGQRDRRGGGRRPVSHFAKPLALL